VGQSATKKSGEKKPNPSKKRTRARRGILRFAQDKGGEVKDDLREKNGEKTISARGEGDRTFHNEEGTSLAKKKGKKSTICER